MRRASGGAGTAGFGARDVVCPRHLLISGQRRRVSARSVPSSSTIFSSQPACKARHPAITRIGGVSTSDRQCPPGAGVPYGNTRVSARWMTTSYLFSHLERSVGCAATLPFRVSIKPPHPPPISIWMMHSGKFPIPSPGRQRNGKNVCPGSAGHAGWCA